MGLDVVELMKAVEERFELHIPDEDAATLTSTRKLIDYLNARVTPATNASRDCATQHAFYRVRKALMAVGVQRAAVVPPAPLAELLPIRTRRRSWKAIRKELGVRSWPELHRRAWLERTVWYGGFATGIAGAVPVLALIPSFVGLALCGTVVAATLGVFHGATYTTAAHFEPRDYTAGELSQDVAAQRPAPPRPYTPDEVASIIESLASQSGPLQMNLQSPAE